MDRDVQELAILLQLQDSPMTFVPNPSVNPRERGVALLATLAAILAIGLFAATVTTMIADTGESHHVQQVGNQAFYLAESGARYAIHRLRTEGLDALDELDGGTFTLANGWGFEVAVDVVDEGSSYTFSIDAVGFSGGRGSSQRQSLNGYQVEVPKYTTDVEVPVGFNYAVQSLTAPRLMITGSAYVDSYDSAVGNWTGRGALQNATIRTEATEDALKLTGTARVFGSVSVPLGADVENYSGIVRVPNWYGEAERPPIVAQDVREVTAIAPPEEPAEVAKPVSWDALPRFKGGSQTVGGGAYSTSRDFSPGSTEVTVSGSLSLNVGDDFTLSGSGDLQVDGAMAAWIADDMKITGGGSGLDIHGDADFLVGGDFQITGSQNVVIDGGLDLDVAGGMKISGSGSLHVKGDAYIDVAGGFDIEGSGSLIIDGKIIVKVGDGLKFSGYQYPLVIGEEGWVQIYVADGKIAINSSQINTLYTPVRFMVFGSSEVDSVKINGNGKMVGTIHAPGAEFSINGSCELFGAVLARSVKKIVGNASIHYDEELSRVWPAPDLPEEPLRRYWTVVGEVD